MNTKSLHVRLPEKLYEEFYRAFPGRGERTRLIEQFVFRAVERSGERKKLNDSLAEEVLEDADGND